MAEADLRCCKCPRAVLWGAEAKAPLMTNSLDLGDEEFDLIDLQVEIESAFGLRLSDEEAESVRTMGDLHVLLMRRIGPAEGDSCLTTMAFLRLRRAIAPLVPDIRLQPIDG